MLVHTARILLLHLLPMFERSVYPVLSQVNPINVLFILKHFNIILPAPKFSHVIFSLQFFPTKTLYAFLISSYMQYVCCPFDPLWLKFQQPRLISQVHT